MKTLFSGIQPSGEVHIGNYLGAIKNWVTLLDDYKSIFSIVDYHAMTVEYDAKLMPRRIYEATVANIAAGLVPEKCILFVQSHVPEHTELTWILGCVTPINYLERMTQFKEKSKQHESNINTGLFSYPILQTADILLYKAEIVPVGEDQMQHVELSRDIVRKFNQRYGDFFNEPKALLSPAPRIMGLDGEKKMSKSIGNHIAIADSAETIFNKLRPAKTDIARQRRKDPGEPKNCNLYCSYHKFFTSEEDLKKVEDGCRTAGIGCIDCKKILVEHMDKELAPIRDRYNDLIDKKDYIMDVLNENAKKARAIAKTTMAEVREKIGLGSLS